MKITPTALSPSDLYLNVLVTVDFPGTQRIAKVQIPWEWLLDSDVLAGLDRIHRRLLIAAWSGEPLPLWDES